MSLSPYVSPILSVLLSFLRRQVRCSCTSISLRIFHSDGSDSKASAYNAGDIQSLGWEDLLEKEIAAYSSILAWKIPWMEEPGRLQSMGLQRVGHD